MRSIENEVSKQRVYWIDTLKFIGMFEIYLGHFFEKAGLAYEFVFTHHVALFFFLAGCTEMLNKETSIKKNIWKKIKNLWIPFIMFAIIDIIIKVITLNENLGNVKEYIYLVLQGCVRNTFFAAGLWFLSCLFVMSIVFQFIKKIQNKVILLVLALVCFLMASQIHIDFYNISSMLYYIIYFVLGYVSFEKINGLLTGFSLKNKILLVVITCGTVFYTTVLFFGVNLLEEFRNITFINRFVPIIETLIVIWFWIIVANIIQNVKMFKDIGKNSLYLCGSEYMIEMLVWHFLSIFGITLTLQTPLATYIYVFVLLNIANKYWVPVLRYTINIITRYVDKIEKIFRLE